MNECRRIWLVNPFSDLPGEGAMEGRYHTLARLFAADGHLVTWWTSSFHHRSKTFRSPLKEVFPFEIVQLPTPAYRRNVSLRRLASHAAYGRAFAREAEARISKEGPPDHIHLSLPTLDCIGPALALRQKTGCRVTVDIMDLWPETFLRLVPGPAFLKPFIGRLVFRSSFIRARRAYREADGVSAVSAEYLEHVLRVAPGQRTHLCYVGGSLLEQPRGHNPETIQEPLTFIYAGSLTKTYDLDTVVEAARLLKAEQVPFRVKIAGSGPEEQRLKDKVLALGLESEISFLGFLDQPSLAAELAGADVGLNAVSNNAFITMPHKLSDYLCAGLAVANSLKGEAEELLKKHDAGMTYGGGDADSLAATMKQWIKDQNFLQQQRLNALNLAKKSFVRQSMYPDLVQWIFATNAESSKNARI